MVGVSFTVCRERYTSGSGPFSWLRVPGRLLMCHDLIFCTIEGFYLLLSLSILPDIFKQKLTIKIIITSTYLTYVPITITITKY